MPGEGVLRGFAGGLAHELRTPLTALSGEIDLALRRPRTLTDYQQALGRIADRAAELIEMTDDLALLGEVGEQRGPAAAVRLDALFAAAAAGSRRAAGEPLVVDPAGRDTLVRGDAKRLARAVSLIVDHALRYRRPQARVRLRGARAAPGRVSIVVDAAPVGFQPAAWRYFARDIAAAEHVHAPGQLRLRTASHIVQDAGGRIDVVGQGHGEAVHIQLDLGSRTGSREHEKR